VIFGWPLAAALPRLCRKQAGALAVGSTKHASSTHQALKHSSNSQLARLEPESLLTAEGDGVQVEPLIKTKVR
jgi:hypothetical protein